MLPFSYYKVTDPASWITVDKNTGELRVANTIDRESKFVQNGMYNITMKAVDASKLLVNAVHFLFTDFYWPGTPQTTEVVIIKKKKKKKSIYAAQKTNKLEFIS